MKGFWNSKSDEEVFRTFKVKELVFIGKYRIFPNRFSMFENIRNLDYSPVLNVKSNINDDSFVRVQIINKSTLKLKQNTYYKISAKIIPQKERIKHSSEFLLEFNDECAYEIYNPDERGFTDQIFKKYSEANSASSQDILKSVKTITYQINKRNETFIYELLQNADDYPKQNQKVIVNFYITDKYLLFTHTGIEFNFNNVYALCSVNAEDKIDDVEKIGFKGIGFKSVFKANEFVYIKSGEYSFRFDKSFHNIEQPWQLMPIWTDVEDLEISLRNNNRFLNSNVAIALRPRNISKTLSEYSDTLELFKDERILLFLRYIEKVNVFINNDKRIFCEKNHTKWWLRDFDITLTDEIIRFLNDQIIEGNEEVPTKFANIAMCKVTFAALIEDNKISLLTDAKLFNYLPLIINLNFPFIINSDFIPDGEREGLINNKWNEFLLVEAGKKFIKYLQVSVQNKNWDKRFCYSIINLIPSFTVISGQLKNNEKWKSYFDFFYTGFKNAVLGKDGNPAEAFIPTKNDGIESLNNILIDDTGLTDLLGEAFPVLTERIEKPIHPEVGEGIEKIRTLLEEYKLGFIYTSKDAKKDFKQDAFQTWLKDPLNNFKLLNHLQCSKDSNLKKLLETEAIILTEDNELNKANIILINIPDEISFGKIHRLNKPLSNLLDLNDVPLPIEKFEPLTFFHDIIIPDKNGINKSLNNETNLKNFWNFIYDNWDAFIGDNVIIKSLKQFNVLCKSGNSPECTYQLVSMTYLSKEYVTEGEIESVIEKLSIEDAYYISPRYISKNRGDIEKWGKIFEKSSAITDLRKVVDVLLPKIQLIQDKRHFEIALELFKISSKLTAEQIKDVRKNLKLKCSDGTFHKISDCYISDHYNNNTLIRDTLPIIELNNQISIDYDIKQKEIAGWKKFYLEVLGCKELSERQSVYESKVSQFISNQNESIYEERHYEIMQSLSGLYSNRSQNKLRFEKELFKKTKLQSTNNNWVVASNLHLSSIYKPLLDLQKDCTNYEEIDILNENYKPDLVVGGFLKLLGVRSGFSISFDESLNISRIKKTDYIKLFLLSDQFQRRLSNLLQRFTQQQINQYTYIQDHVSIPHIQYSLNPNNNKVFWDFLKKESLELIVKETSIVNNGSTYFTYDNSVVHFLKTQNATFNQNYELCKTVELYSIKLSKFIQDKSKIPLEDLSQITIGQGEDQDVTLEEIIGINTHLSQGQCIEVLKRSNKRLTIKDIEEFDIVSILEEYEPSDEEKEDIFLLNKNNEWRKVKTLCVLTDDSIEIDPSLVLNEIFEPLVGQFGIPELSEDALVIITDPENPPVSDELIEFFDEKAKFIAYKINPEDLEEFEK